MDDGLCNMMYPWNVMIDGRMTGRMTGFIVVPLYFIHGSQATQAIENGDRRRFSLFWTLLIVLNHFCTLLQLCPDTWCKVHVKNTLTKPKSSSSLILHILTTISLWLGLLRCIENRLYLDTQEMLFKNFDLWSLEPRCKIIYPAACIAGWPDNE